MSIYPSPTITGDHAVITWGGLPKHTKYSDLLPVEPANVTWNSRIPKLLPGII